MLQTIVKNGERNEKVPIETQKVPIQNEKVPIDAPKVLSEKLIDEKSISEIMKRSIVDLYKGD